MSPASLVLVHGFLGSASSWDGLVSRLSPEVHVERLELLGHSTEPSRDEESVECFDDEVTRLLDRLRHTTQPSPRWLVGYSLGARVALGLAARSEVPFERVILVSGRDGLTDRDEARARSEVDDALARVLLDEGLAAFIDRWEGLPLFSSQRALPLPERLAHRARRLAHEPSRVARALHTLSLGRMPSYASAAFSRTSQVTLVVGEHDPKFRALAAELAHAHCARCVVMDGAGHDVVLERPDALATLLEEPS